MNSFEIWSDWVGGNHQFLKRVSHLKHTISHYSDFKKLSSAVNGRVTGACVLCMFSNGAAITFAETERPACLHYI